MTKGKTSYSILVAAVIGCALFATAAVPASDAVKVNSKVAYLDQSVGSDGIRECHWDERLIQYLVKYAKGGVEVTDEDLDKLPGKTLKLTAVAIHSSGGAEFAGPKWLKLRAELRVNGKVVSNFEKSSHSTVDPFRWTACSVMVKMSKQLGRYTANWLTNPITVVDTGADDKPDADEPADSTARSVAPEAPGKEPAASAAEPQAKEPNPN